MLYEWDLDGDGFDDGTNNAIIWNPAEHDLGTFTITVRATVNGITSTASTEILVIAAFKVGLGNPVAVAGRKSSIGATVSNYPLNSVLTFSWELDGDGGDFDDIADPP